MIGDIAAQYRAGRPGHGRNAPPPPAYWDQRCTVCGRTRDECRAWTAMLQDKHA